MSQIRTSLISKLADLVDEYGDQSPQDVDSLYDLSDHDEGEFFERREHIDKAIDSSTISRSLSLANLKNIPIENLISHPRLGNLLNKLHYILYLNVNQLKQDNVDSNVDSHLEVVESLIDYVSGQSKAVKFDSIDSLLIGCLYSIASFVHLTQPAQRLDAKIGVISAKINLLFDGKLTGLEEPGQKPMLFKALKYFVYLIEHIKDPKCIVTLWKLFSKLVFKLKILIPISTHRHSAMIRKIFDILVVDQKMNLKHIKMTLKNQSSLNGESLPSQSFNSQSISSQIRFTNNVVQDTIKVIKLSSFLFKILSTFLRLHLSDLLTDDDDNNASQSLTSILVQISSICLDEASPISLDNEDINTSSFETTSKRFNAIKLDFIKEYAPNFEQLLQCVLNEPRFIDSLNQIDRVLQEDEESFNHSSILLFFAICLNKHEAEFEKSMEEIMRLLILSQEQIYSPIYSTYSKKLTQDPQLDFNRLVADSDTRAVEFYDLLLLIVSKFTLQSGLSPSKVYYLVANITSQEPVRSQLAYDLTLYLLRHYASTSNFPNFLHLVKFISVVYESTNSVGLKQLLNEMLNDSAPPSSVATDLEQYYTTNKMHRCLSLMNSNLLLVLAANTVGCSIEMLDCLLKMMSTSPSEPIAVRKSLQYVQTNKMIQVLELAAGLLLKSVDKGAPSSQLVDLAEKCARKLSEFVRADKIDALLVNSQSQRVLFELLLRALNLLAVTLLVFSDDDILLGLIEFYLKWCSNKSKISSQNESLKFAPVECLRLMARRKQALNNQQIQSKMIELFQEILDESNCNANLRYFALECLNDYSNSDEPSKNRVFCQLNRMGLNKLISGYLVEIEIDPSFDLSKYLSDRLSSTSSAVSGGYSSQQPGNSQLDETMNVLMSAASMDTTISAENEIDESEMARERLEKIETDLRALVGSYPTGRLPNWLRAQLNNLSQFISKNL